MVSGSTAGSVDRSVRHASISSVIPWSVDRLIALGAQRVEGDYPEDADFVVLADPAGRLCCVIA